MTTRKELLPGVFLTSIQDGRFKTACFSLSFLRPLRAGEAAMNALLPSVLLRGSEKTPSIRAIADRLDELRGASIGALVRKKGEIQLTGLFADCLEDQYAGEAVFSHLLDFVSELLFCPRTEHGAFVPELVSQECRNLQNAMQSVLDDKSAYCERQLLRAMCGANATPAAVSESRKSLIKSTCARSGRTISRAGLVARGAFLSRQQIRRRSGGAAAAASGASAAHGLRPGRNKPQPAAAGASEVFRNNAACAEPDLAGLPHGCDAAKRAISRDAASERDARRR